ncbi:MAG: hypothetical protein DLM73_16190, partial [Chthoniobacterales bacterium]
MPGMPPLLSDYLLLLWVVVSVLATGVALCSRFTPLKGMELIGYGTGAGVLIHGLLGLLIGLGWHLRHFFAVLAVLGAALAVNYLIRRRIWRELAESLNRSMRLALGLWLFLLVLCPALVRVEVRWPATLPDGTYIFKKHGLNVKVQYLTTLPAD